MAQAARIHRVRAVVPRQVRPAPAVSGVATAVAALPARSAANGLVQAAAVAFPAEVRVTCATFAGVAAGERAGRWLVLAVRVPAEPSRHRVAVWRELRRAGAVSLGQGCWAVPDVPAIAGPVSRATELASRGGGEVIALRAAGRDEADAARLAGLFTQAREAEWAEFIADCGKFDAEIDSEIAKGKFTLAELEEEEQSMERLRRWHRELATRDVFGAPSAAEAAQQLKHCAERLADYTEQVFRAVHQM
jgi:hypothetical protein